MYYFKSTYMATAFQRLICSRPFITCMLHILDLTRLSCCPLCRLVYIKHKILKIGCKIALFSEFTHPHHRLRHLDFTYYLNIQNFLPKKRPLFCLLQIALQYMRNPCIFVPRFYSLHSGQASCMEYFYLTFLRPMERLSA